MADRTVKVTAILQAQQYIAGLEQMKRKTRETSQDGKASLEDQKAAYQALGSTALAFGGFAAAGVALAVTKFAEFDSAMSSVQAATGESAEGMSALRDAALQAGADTAFSATEAANAVEELGKAGLSSADILSGGLTGALSLAAAGGLGVARAAEISATALQQFQLEGSDAGHVADVLAAGANKALGSVDDLANGLKFVGPLANSMGVSIEETTGTLALFAKAGLVGSEGGTALRSVLSSLTSPSKAAQKEIERLGITLYDSSGQFLGINNAAGELNRVYGTMDQQARAASAGIIFGAEAITGATVLYQEGAAGVNGMTAAVNDSGFAAEQAATKLDNLKGDVEALSGSFETALIQSGSAANDTLRFLTQTATESINAFSGMPPAMQGTSLAVAGVTAAVGLGAGAFFTAVPKIAEYKSALADMTPGVQKTAGVLGGLTKALGIAAVVGTAALALDKLVTSSDLAAKSLETTTAALQNNKVGDLFAGLGSDVHSFSDALDLLYGSSLEAQGERFSSTLNGIFAGGQLSDQVARTKEQFNTLGASLAEMVNSGDGERAAALFQELADKAEEQGYSTEQLMQLLGPYGEALQGVANDQQTVAAASEQNAEALELLSGKAESAETDLDSLAEAIRGFGSAQLDVNSATREFEASLDELTQSVIDNGVELDVGTEKGRANQAALDAIASSALGLASATLTRTGSETEAAAAVQRGRDELIKQLAQFGITGQAAEDYADNLGLIPGDVSTAVALTNVEASEARLAYLARNRTSSITVVTNSPNGAAFSDARSSVGSANGNIFAYANGGFPTGIYAGRAGAIHKFAEPETRWEAYISGKPGQESRNIAIWEEAGKRLGAIDAFANGGIDPRSLAPMPSFTVGGGTNSSTVVNLAVNHNGDLVAVDPAGFARQQTRELKRGLALTNIKGLVR